MSTNAGETTVRGDFEEGVDGWTADGGTQLTTVTRSVQRFGVTHGSRALEVQVDGDGFPHVGNRRDVEQADLVEYPYLIADVTPGMGATVEPSGSFQFRLHHSDGRGQRAGEVLARDAAEDEILASLGEE